MFGVLSITVISYRLLFGVILTSALRAKHYFNASSTAIWHNKVFYGLTYGNQRKSNGY